MLQFVETSFFRSAFCPCSLSLLHHWTCFLVNWRNKQAPLLKDSRRSMKLFWYEWMWEFCSTTAVTIVFIRSLKTTLGPNSWGLSALSVSQWPSAPWRIFRSHPRLPASANNRQLDFFFALTKRNDLSQSIIINGDLYRFAETPSYVLAPLCM